MFDISGLQRCNLVLFEKKFDFVLHFPAAEYGTVCGKQVTAALVPAVIFHHSLCRGIVWIGPCLVMNVSSVPVHCQVRLRVWKDQIYSFKLIASLTSA